MKSPKINGNMILFLLVLVLSVFYSNQYSISQRKVYLKIHKENLDNIETLELITYDFSSEEINKVKTLRSKNKDSLILPVSKSLIKESDVPRELKVFSKNSKFTAILSQNNKLSSNNFKSQSQPLNHYDIEVSSNDDNKAKENSLKSIKHKNKDDPISFDLEYLYKIEFQKSSETDISSRDSNKTLKEESHQKEKIPTLDKRRKFNFSLSSFDNAKNIESNAELILQFIGFKNGIKIDENENEKSMFSNSIDKDGVTEYKINLKLTNNSNKSININFTENPEVNKISKDKDIKASNTSVNKDSDSKAKLKQTKPIEKKNIKLLTRQEADEPTSSKNTTSSDDVESTPGKSPLMSILTIFYLLAMLFVCFLCFCITTPKNDEKDTDVATATNNNGNTMANREGADGGDHVHS